MKDRKQAAPSGVKVRVRMDIPENSIGFFDHARRRPGDVFVLPNEPRRDLFAGEQKLIAQEETAREAYDAIKSEDGKVPQGFSFKWMEPVPSATPEKISTSQEAVSKKNEDTKNERAGQKALDAGGAAAGGPKDVI